MRIVTVTVMASALAVSSLSHAVKVGSDDNWYPGEELTQHSMRSHIFDSISSTEHQCQQMRDLMQQARHGQPPVNVGELETVHRLVTAENLDENAVCARVEKMANEQIARQVEMAKVRNQMYRLLTPGQQTVSNEKHQQRMEQLRDATQWQRSLSLKLLSSSNSYFQQ